MFLAFILEKMSVLRTFSSVLYNTMHFLSKIKAQTTLQEQCHISFSHNVNLRLEELVLRLSKASFSSSCLRGQRFIRVETSAP